MTDRSGMTPAQTKTCPSCGGMLNRAGRCLVGGDACIPTGGDETTIPLFRQEALSVMREAWRIPNVTKTFTLFSGGNDSTVLAHWAQPYSDGLVHIDTGTALPGVREFVEDFARRYGMPLKVYEAGDAYEKMVLDRGFPGPGAHLYAYTLLKERQIRQLIREQKQHHSDRIMLLAGVRRAESARRMGTAKPVHRDGAQVWVNPLIDWSNEDMRAYREKHKLPQSDVAALMHRSGECNCGAYAAPGERQDIATFYPEFDRWLTGLERRAEEAGVHCRWGERPPDDNPFPVNADAPMCSDCQLRLDEAA